MFIVITDKETKLKVLINKEHIVSIIECDDFGYCRIITDMIDPETGNFLYYDAEAESLHSIINWDKL